MVSRASAWASPEVTPASQAADEALVIIQSEVVTENKWAKCVPSSPLGFARLAKQAGWRVEVRYAKAENSKRSVSSWSIKTFIFREFDGYKVPANLVAVWEQHLGDVAESKKKCHVTTAYVISPLMKTNVTTLKNILKESA